MFWNCDCHTSIQAMPTIRHCLKKGAKSVVLWPVLRTSCRMSDLSFPGLLICQAIILPQPWPEVHTWADQMAKLWSTSNMFNRFEIHIYYWLLSINVSFSRQWCFKTPYAMLIYDNTLQHSSLSHSVPFFVGFLNFARKYSLAPVAKAVETCNWRICKTNKDILSDFDESLGM